MTRAYRSNTDLPPSIQSELPKEAQDVFRLAYNSAVASSHMVEGAKDAGWRAVLMGWVKKGRTWVKRSEIKVEAQT